MDLKCFDIAHPGEAVRFTAQGGYPDEKTNALSVLAIDGIYIVARVEVGGWFSTYTLEGVPGLRFNTCLFEPVVGADV